MERLLGDKGEWFGSKADGVHRYPQRKKDHEQATKRQVLTLLNPLIVTENRTKPSNTMTTERTTTRRITTTTIFRARPRTESTTTTRYTATSAKRTRNKI